MKPTAGGAGVRGGRKCIHSKALPPIDPISMAASVSFRVVVGGGAAWPSRATLLVGV